MGVPLLRIVALLPPKTDFNDFLDRFDIKVFLLPLTLAVAGVLEAELRFAGWEGGGEVSTRTWLSFNLLSVPTWSCSKLWRGELWLWKRELLKLLLSVEFLSSTSLPGPGGDWDWLRHKTGAWKSATSGADTRPNLWSVWDSAWAG